MTTPIRSILVAVLSGSLDSAGNGTPVECKTPVSRRTGVIARLSGSGSIYANLFQSSTLETRRTPNMAIRERTASLPHRTLPEHSHGQLVREANCLVAGILLPIVFEEQHRMGLKLTVRKLMDASSSTGQVSEGAYNRTLMLLPRSSLRTLLADSSSPAARILVIKMVLCRLFSTEQP
jgi:hypothetical protein